MQQTPRSNRLHLTLFGRRNVGKSSLINALAGQEVALASPTPGTTTDPVGKAMEWLPLGPVFITDTPGLDDSGTLGGERVRRAMDALRYTDVALVVVEAAAGFGEVELQLLEQIKAMKAVPVIIFNKGDLTHPTEDQLALARRVAGPHVYSTSTRSPDGIAPLRQGLSGLKLNTSDAPGSLLGDLLAPGDIVLLVAPIDSAAPKGRLILPQQQTIRDILDASACAMTVQPSELPRALASLKQPPRLVITDSQVFKQVAAILPPDIPLTSFSILFARLKGDLQALVAGARHIDSLRDGDRILMAEGCTHHRQEDDIGTVKIPHWLQEHTGRRLHFEHTAGMQYPPDLKDYALIVHCGACMLNAREMNWRIQQAQAAGVPIVNYGVLIAHLNGILDRAVSIFSGLLG